MHKKLILSGVIAAVLVFATYVALCRYQPPLPERWHRITRGQPRIEVLASFPELNTDLYNLKAFDQTVLVSHSRLFGRVWRNIHVRYDYSSGTVEGVWVITRTGRFDFFRDQ